MEEVKEEELKNIQGGGAGLAIGVGFVIGAIITLIAGFLDGYTSPNSCNCKG